MGARETPRPARASLVVAVAAALGAVFGILGAAAFSYARDAASNEITACVDSDGGGLYIAEVMPSGQPDLEKKKPRVTRAFL